MNTVIASANANIALIKYWGKRDEFFMLPTKSSISVSLDALKTTTEIGFGNSDTIKLNGVFVSDNANVKILRFLHVFRKKFATYKSFPNSSIQDTSLQYKYLQDSFFQINSVNNFPTAAGLASSASGFAALAKGLNELCGLKLDSKELSILARRGSGSASRSIIGGFNLWHKGVCPQGSDSYSEQIFKADHWPDLRIIITVVQAKQKPISSTQAMQVTVKTSKIYQDWLRNSERRVKLILDAIGNKDLDIVGELAQIDCLEMHETMRTSNPPINYWTDKTVKIIELVNKLRASGVQCYFTIDAGPNVKILTLEKYQDKILAELKNIEDIQTIVSGVAGD
ncbi:MAG: diphosphomevalonate decarboxylase [Candidatus Babeliales bacterium]|jgi:diphosphomevalonate decarboxylase